jgi:tetratricopeptide (TPR) repeat protein
MSAWILAGLVLIHGWSDPPKSDPQIDAITPAAKAGSPVPNPAIASSLDIGGWLVNLARHEGHLIGRSDPRRASLHVMALLEAAKEVAPDCADAYFWLHDLYQRMGRTADAKVALAQYVRLNPADDTARIKLLNMEMDDLQTAESRALYIRNELAAKGMSPIYESELHRWMAKYHHERGEQEPAGREIETALRLNAMNVPARRLAYEMFGETEASLQRVEMALQLIAINPSQVNLVWDLAEFLDRISMHKQAQEWYNRAIDLHRKSESGPISATLLQKPAISYTCSEDYTKAVQTADEAIKADPNYQPARLLRANAQAKLSNAAAAEVDRQAVLRAYQARVRRSSRKLSDRSRGRVVFLLSPS